MGVHSLGASGASVHRSPGESTAVGRLGYRLATWKDGAGL